MILKYVLISLATLISLASMSESDPTKEASITGFTTDLIHRDLSPQSPSYDPSLSPSQRISKALKRSFHRFNTPSKQSSKSELRTNAAGQYLLKYTVGTPPTPVLGIVDTGSDLIWTQCQPCKACFGQRLPVFNPKNSPTYRKIRCNTTNCNSLPEITSCSGDKRNCLYSFFDSNLFIFTSGQLATDAFTLPTTGESLSLRRIKFGCGFDNSAENNFDESGVVGLGHGKFSLVRQLGRLAQGRFSYCLVPFSDEKSNSSKLSFGSEAEVSGGGAVSTPLITREGDSFYYLTMEGISVGNQRIEIRSAPGNTILYVGEPVTFLPFDHYAEVEAAIKNSIKLDQVEDPELYLDLCYFSRQDIEHVPQVTLHFKGADVKLKYENVFVRRNEAVVCLAVLPRGDAIYGNLAQANFLVGYDLDKRIVTFKPTNCAK